MAYDNTNRGSLNRNQRKEKDTHPDFKGKLNVDGVDYWLDGWTKKSDDGSSWLSLSVKRKEQAPAKQESKPARREEVDPMDDDIPF